MSDRKAPEVSVLRMVRPMFAALIGLTLLQAIDANKFTSNAAVEKEMQKAPRVLLHVPAVSERDSMLNIANGL